MSESGQRNRHDVLYVFSDMSGGIAKRLASEKMRARLSKLRTANITVIVDDISRFKTAEEPRKEGAE